MGATSALTNIFRIFLKELMFTCGTSDCGTLTPCCEVGCLWIWISRAAIKELQCRLQRTTCTFSEALLHAD